MRFQQKTTPETVAYSSSSAAAPTFSWPDAVAYREAIQLPHLSLFEPWLQSAEISLDRRGLPIVYTGRFAVVFRLTTATGERWALRCFTSALEGQDRIARYDAIRETLEEHEETLAPYFVPFVFLPQGVKVGTTKTGTAWYPALAMRWASGKPLGRWVEENRYHPEKLRGLCGVLSGLLQSLETADIAHGDWQHDNLLVSETGNAVTLVDYDGLYVPALAGNPAAESGHPNYQHPFRSPLHYGPGMDRFACLVIQTALLGLSHDPSLWERFSDGESLLFKKVDFTDTERSPLFRTLRELAETHQDELLADSVARLQDACLADAGSVLAPAIEAVAPPDTPSFVGNLPIPAVKGTTQQPHDANGGAGRGKWWLLPEVSTRPAPVSIVQAAAQAAGISPGVQQQKQQRQRSYSLAASAQQSQTTFKYLNQLYDAEVQAAEQRHLWGWRAGAVGFLAMVSLLIYAWISSRNGFFPFYFFWLINFANLGYTRWPRKRIYDELVAEITKMENLIEARQKNIAEKSGPQPVRYQVGAQGVTTQGVSDFVADRLKQTSINRVLTVPGINVSTLRQLRAEGIDTALDLQRRTNISRVPPHQTTALQNWCRELESQAQDEYRKASGATQTTVGNPKPTIPVDVARLQHEVAEFERHVELLKQERDQFPDTSAGSYARKLFGITEVNPQATP